MRLRVLDLFCGAGGAARGYHDGFTAAGFDVEITGVDIEPQPNYPYTFVQADAMTYPLDGFDFIHASPPCQAYSKASANGKVYPDLYAATRARLETTPAPYVIENVIGAPYHSGVILCGSMFGMKIRRHRNFETSMLLMQPACDHASQGRAYTITGHGGGSGRHSLKPPASEFWRYLDMPWATPYEVTQAIPPAYTAFLAEQIAPVLVAAAGQR